MEIEVIPGSTIESDITFLSQGGFHLQLLLKKTTNKQNKLKIISRHLLVSGVVSVVNTLVGMQEEVETEITL
jgi:hypothetical protein